MTAATEQAQSKEPPIIVVGVSVATGSKLALQWAVQEARLRHARVRAVMAWHTAGLPGGAPGRPPAQKFTSIDQRELAEERLVDAITDALGDVDDVERRAVQGRPRTVLLQESQDACLLVLDSPRMAKLTSPGARRLAPQLIFRARCPVVVMPAPSDISDAAKRGLEPSEADQPDATAAIAG